MKDILKQLTGFSGPPGHEKMLTGFISDLFSKYCDEVKIDKLYNVIGIKRANRGSGTRRKVMVAAHIDEISMMVSDVDERGFIRFAPLGGIDPRILLAQETIIHGRKQVYGVVGTKPPHLISDEEKKKPMEIDKLYIDTGMSRDQLASLVEVGDTITFKHHWTELQNGLVSSKSLDNRGGAAAVIGLLQEADRHGHDIDIVCVATVQEEVGLRGAVTSAYGIQPDTAVVIDACHGDMPGLDSDEVFKLGKGPAIAVGPNIHPQLGAYLKQIAVEQGIPYQVDVEAGNTGTDAWAIQVSRSGIPTVLVSFPLRYMHTTVETVSLEDLDYISKLLAYYINNLGGKLEELAL